MYAVNNSIERRNSEVKNVEIDGFVAGCDDGADVSTGISLCRRSGGRTDTLF